jgi:hypothetical protein
MKICLQYNTELQKSPVLVILLIDLLTLVSYPAYL